MRTINEISNTSPPIIASYGTIFIMNKRAKKRLKEAIAKDKQDRKEALPQQRPGASKDPAVHKGFLPKPEKKRG